MARSSSIREHIRRSREGAWIEMSRLICVYIFGCGRSREGAWIEIFAGRRAYRRATVAPARERGLK